MLSAHVFNVVLKIFILRFRVMRFRTSAIQVCYLQFTSIRSECLFYIYLYQKLTLPPSPLCIDVLFNFNLILLLFWFYFSGLFSGLQQVYGTSTRHSFYKYYFENWYIFKRTMIFQGAFCISCVANFKAANELIDNILISLKRNLKELSST